MGHQHQMLLGIEVLSSKYQDFLEVLEGLILCSNFDGKLQLYCKVKQFFRRLSVVGFVTHPGSQS